VCCSVLQCVAVCCSVLQCVAVCVMSHTICNMTQMCDMTCSVWDVMLQCVYHMTHPCVWHETRSYAWHDSFTCVTWLIYICDMTHSWHDLQCVQRHVAVYVTVCSWHDLTECVTRVTHVCSRRKKKCVTRPIHMCDMTHSCMWHDSFMCVTRLIHMCDMTLFICVTWLIHVCDLRLNHTGDMTHSYTYEIYDSICCALNWICCAFNMTYSYHLRFIRVWYINDTRHVTQYDMSYDISTILVTWLIHTCVRHTIQYVVCVYIYICIYLIYICISHIYVCVCVCVHWIEYVVRSDCCALNHSVTRAVEACNVYFCTNEPNISAKEPHITSKEPWDVQFNVMRVQVASKRGGWAAGAHKRALYLHKKARHRRKKALYFRKRVRISTKEPYISAKSPVSPQKALRRTIQCDVRATRAHVASSWHWIARLRALLTWYRALLRKSAVDEPQEGAKEPCISTKSTETYDSMWCACNLRTNAVEEP